MSVQPSSTSGAVPSGWSVDHEAPDEFVVRCTRCGRVSIEDARGRAHRLADNYTLVCSPTGVTPVSRPQEPGGGVEPEPDDSVVVAGVDALRHDVVGEALTVRYQSVDPSSGGREVSGDVVAMLPADDEADIDHRGFILRLPTKVRRRVDIVAGTMECKHNSTTGWRSIGDVTAVSPASRVDSAPVAMTDGGVQVDESEATDQPDDGDQEDDPDDGPDSRPDTLTTAIEAGTLEQTVDILQSVADECIFNLGRDGLDVRLVDPGNVYMADLQLSSNAFERVGDGLFAIGVNLDRLKQILGKADSDDIVELVLDTETRKLHLEFSNVEMDFAGIDPDKIRAEPDLPDLDLPNEFESEARHLQRAVGICQMVSDRATVGGDLDPECIHLTADGDTDDARVELDEELGFADVREDASSIFSIDEASGGSSGYLDEALGVIPKTTPISVAFGEEFPIWIEWEFADGSGQVTQMIAPRVEAD
jgi:proliferating cell nuclear antigen